MVFRPRTRFKIAKKTKRCPKCGKLVAQLKRCPRCSQVQHKGR